MARRQLSDVLTELEAERERWRMADAEAERLRAQVRELADPYDTPERWSLNSSALVAMKEREDARQKIKALRSEREFLELQAKHGTAPGAPTVYASLLAGNGAGLGLILEKLLASSSEPAALLLAGCLAFALGLVWLVGRALIAPAVLFGRLTLGAGAGLAATGGLLLIAAIFQGSPS